MTANACNSLRESVPNAPEATRPPAPAPTAVSLRQGVEAWRAVDELMRSALHLGAGWTGRIPPKEASGQRLALTANSFLSIEGDGKLRLNDGGGEGKVALDGASAMRVSQALCHRLVSLAANPHMPNSEEQLVLLAAQRLLDKMQHQWRLQPAVRLEARELERTLIATSLRLAEQDLGEARRLLDCSSIRYHSVNNEALRKKWLDYGFSPEVLAKYPDMVSALLRTHLHRALLTFGHTLELDANSHEPLLLVGGEKWPWSRVAKEFRFEQDKVLADDDLRTRWTYLDSGLVPWDPENWTTLRPMKTLPTGQWPKQHVLQIVTCSGYYHAWCRLVTPAGQVYSFGMGIHRDLNDHRAAAASTLAHLSCPDPYEFLPTTQLAVDIAITTQQFALIKSRVEALNKLGVHFNWLDQNCTVFAAYVAELAGEHIALEESPSQLCCPVTAQRYFRRAVPDCVRDTIDTAVSCLGKLGPTELINLGVAAAGGCQGVPYTADGGLLEDSSVGALIGGPRDLFKDVVIYDPRHLHAWQQEKLAERARNGSHGAAGAQQAAKA